MAIHYSELPPAAREAVARLYGGGKGKRPRFGIGKKPRDGADDLAAALDAAHLVGWVREHAFHPTRKWRFDFAWTAPGVRLAVEVQGLGRHGRMSHHQTADGMAKDCEKLAAAAALGWRVIPVTTRQVKSGKAVEWIARALA